MSESASVETPARQAASAENPGLPGQSAATAGPTKRELVFKYYAATREERAAMYEKHPEIRETFSQGNHHPAPASAQEATVRQARPEAPAQQNPPAK